ncbi:MAG: DMT family transporter [Alphaproteobacteria bacterium]
MINKYDFMITSYVFLIAAVILGTASNIFAKEAEGFTKIFPSLLSALTIVLCMYCLSQVMKTISAGYTYATFAGLCIIATTIIGVLRFNQWPNFYAFIGLIFIIIGVVLVNLMGKN